MNFKTNNKLKILALFLLLFLICLIALNIGPTSNTLKDTIKILLAKLPVLGQYIDLGGIKESQQTIILNIRLPRILLAALVGIALATTGAAFQGLLKNPMADPYIIGISSGAALGAAIAIVSGLSLLIGFFALPLMAFMGGLFSVLTVYNLARVGNKVPIYNLLLSGVALSSFFSAVTSLLMILNSQEMSQIVFWLLGSFSGRKWHHVQIAAPLIIAGVVALNFYARELNLMLFGESTAQSLGVNIEKVKKTLLVISSLTVATAVAASGTIGFVGLIIPHGVRLVVGPDHRILMPVAAITGGIFMVLTDTLARTLMSPTEIPVGIITSIFGGPFFIYLLKQKNIAKG